MTGIPTLLHIPHSSRLIPPEYLASYELSQVELADEQLKLVDLYTDELYRLEGATRAVFPVSRFLVDAERFADDTQESMAARGMGALYTVTTQLEPLRPRPDEALRTALLAKYYTPHHEGLNSWAAQAIATHGHALLIDCHSYPSKALPYELENTALARPQIGIGTDSFHTPSTLREAVATAFTELGYEVGLDEPFRGTLTPAACYGREARLFAFMIEIRKDLYMNEETGEKLKTFGKVQADVGMVLQLARTVASGLKATDQAA